VRAGAERLGCELVGRDRTSESFGHDRERVDADDAVVRQAGNVQDLPRRVADLLVVDLEDLGAVRGLADPHPVGVDGAKSGDLADVVAELEGVGVAAVQQRHHPVLHEGEPRHLTVGLLQPHRVGALLRVPPVSR
jgi:hypothetical protein